MRFLSSMSATMKKVLPNGYLTCNPLKDHNKELFKCLLKKKTPMVGCGHAGLYFYSIYKTENETNY